MGLGRGRSGRQPENGGLDVVSGCGTAPVPDHAMIDWLQREPPLSSCRQSGRGHSAWRLSGAATDRSCGLAVRRSSCCHWLAVDSQTGETYKLHPGNPPRLIQEGSVPSFHSVRDDVGGAGWRCWQNKYLTALDNVNKSRKIWL